MKKIAISVGDLNGVGIELILRSHKEVVKLCKPVYCINKTMLEKSAKLLDIELDDSFEICEVDGDFDIEIAKISALAGRYSYNSFIKAIELTKNKECEAVVTMPIHKEAWSLANIKYKGHTDLLRDYFKKDAIMMLGCESMYVALFSEHIPLKDVSSLVKEDNLLTFFKDFYNSLKPDKVAVLGLNPHAGDNGVLGNEEVEITKAIDKINSKLGSEVFIGPVVPDVAFTPSFRKNFKYFIAMYHDQGLAPLKALYFDESVNISLNLPIVRTSVDHGTAFDIAYKNIANNKSYINAIKSALEMI
jgi:4-hydroxythreonine-4-phosphate dehydrogenase